MKDLFSLYCLSLHFYLPFTADFRTVVVYKLFIYLLVRYMYCIWLNVKTEVHALKVKWYIKPICNKLWQIVIQIQTLKKIYKFKSQFQNFKRAASNESNTACACVLVKVVLELHHLIKTTINYLCFALQLHLLHNKIGDRVTS